jgi:hypothetical protein
VGGGAGWRHAIQNLASKLHHPEEVAVKRILEAHICSGAYGINRSWRGVRCLGIFPKQTLQLVYCVVAKNVLHKLTTQVRTAFGAISV